MFGRHPNFGAMFQVGLHRDVPDSAFDPKQLAVGIDVEMEHTDSRAIAREIAADHLSEDPRYYYKLCQRVEPDEPVCKPLLGRKP